MQLLATSTKCKCSNPRSKGMASHGAWTIARPGLVVFAWCAHKSCLQLLTCNFRKDQGWVSVNCSKVASRGCAILQCSPLKINHKNPELHVLREVTWHTQMKIEVCFLILTCVYWKACHLDVEETSVNGKSIYSLKVRTSGKIGNFCLLVVCFRGHKMWCQLTPCSLGSFENI